MKHGGDPALIYPEYKGDWLDLSTGINPFAYPWAQKIPKDIIEQASMRLPTEGDYENTIHAYADYLKADAKNITLASGSQNLIEKLPFLFEKTSVYIRQNTYSEHEISWAKAGHKIVKYKNLEALKNINSKSIVIFCAPNNPDGDHPDITAFITAHAQAGGYVVVDEAFIDLCPQRSLIAENLQDRVIILRSFGKFFGLAGLRLGLAYSTEPLNIPSGLWGISTLSLVIAAHALQDHEWIEQNRRDISAAMMKLKNLFDEKNYKIIGGTDLFCLVEGADKDKLARAGIFVRSFAHYPQNILRFGLPKTAQDFTKLKEQL